MLLNNKQFIAFKGLSTALEALKNVSKNIVLLFLPLGLCEVAIHPIELNRTLSLEQNRLSMYEMIHSTSVDTAIH